MARFGRFEEMEVWQKARVLAGDIFFLSSRGTLGKAYALRDQIQTAAISIPSNIAEGHERNGSREFLQFLSTAKGSTGELRAQLYLALDQGLLDRSAFERLLRQTEEVARMVSGLMTYLRKSSLKGAKFRS